MARLYLPADDPERAPRLGMAVSSVDVVRRQPHRLPQVHLHEGMQLIRTIFLIDKHIHTGIALVMRGDLLSQKIADERLDDGQLFNVNIEGKSL